jgi:hypothetical protein
MSFSNRLTGVKERKIAQDWLIAVDGCNDRMGWPKLLI